MRTLALAALLGLALAHADLAQPQSTLDRKADYEAVRRQIQMALDSGRYRDAKDLLVTKLAEHQGADYLREDLEAIRADVKTCSFRLAYPRKLLRELIDGDLKLADAKTGQVTIVYDRKEREAKKPPLAFPGADFESIGADLQTKYSFDGPYTVQFTGSRLGLTPIVRVGIERKDDVFESFLFEINRAGLTCLDRVQGEDVSNITNCTNDFDIRKPYVMKVCVREAQIEAFLNNRRVVVGKKPPAHYGRLSYRSFSELERIEIAGKLDRRWIDDQVEARSRVDLAEFEKTYDAKADLPDWLR